MQLRLPIHTDAPPTSPVDPATAVPMSGLQPATELQRLQAELAELQLRQVKQERRRAIAGQRIRKLRDRQRSLALQIESLQNNPYAIGRYRSRVPASLVSTLWSDRPTSELKLESVTGLGAKRLRVLYDRCPTIGDMEVFRVYEGLTKIPGLRKVTVDRIENRLFDWLARHAHDYSPMPSAECGGAKVEFKMPRVI